MSGGQPLSLVVLLPPDFPNDHPTIRVENSEKACPSYILGFAKMEQSLEHPVKNSKKKIYIN